MLRRLRRPPNLLMTLESEGQPHVRPSSMKAKGPFISMAWRFLPAEPNAGSVIRLLSRDYQVFGIRRICDEAASQFSGWLLGVADCEELDRCRCRWLVDAERSANSRSSSRRGGEHSNDGNSKEVLDRPGRFSIERIPGPARCSPEFRTCFGNDRGVEGSQSRVRVLSHWHLRSVPRGTSRADKFVKARLDDYAGIRIIATVGIRKQAGARSQTRKAALRYRERFLNRNVYALWRRRLGPTEDDSSAPLREEGLIGRGSKAALGMID